MESGIDINLNNISPAYTNLQTVQYEIVARVGYSAIHQTTIYNLGLFEKHLNLQR